jgi:hypothetical protein
MAGKVDMKDYFSKDFKSLLEKLLEKDSSRRIKIDEVIS